MLSADLAARCTTPYYVTARGFLSWPKTRMVMDTIRPWEQRSAVVRFYNNPACDARVSFGSGFRRYNTILAGVAPPCSQQ